MITANFHPLSDNKQFFSNDLRSKKKLLKIEVENSFCVWFVVSLRIQNQRPVSFSCHVVVKTILASNMIQYVIKKFRSFR